MKNFKIRNVKINSIEIALLFGLVFAIFGCVFNSVHQTNKICSDSIRLHILANSNSAADQNLKLKVRNSILNNLNLNKLNSNPAETKAYLKLKLPEIKEIAQQTILNSGYNYSVEPEISNHFFETRAFGNYTAPSGYYDAIKVKIGEAKGNNWWCLIASPLCIPAAKKQPNLNKNNKQQSDLLKKGSKTEVRFFIADLINKFKKKQ